MMKVSELRQKTDSELLHELEVLKKGLFNIRFNKVVDYSNSNVHKAKFFRKDVARIKTILTERENGV